MNMSVADWIVPDWPAPRSVMAVVSTRTGPGVPPYDSFNLGLHRGALPAAVLANRRALMDALGLPASPRWLRQVHGIAVAGDERLEPTADAAVTVRLGEPLAILTADCLPVLFCDSAGTRIGAAHAGWRGLAAGVLEATVAALGTPPGQLMAWLGPCIAGSSYEVDEAVREAFIKDRPVAESCFSATRPGHWHCHLTALARQRLGALGIRRIHGGGFDTFSDPRLYSYRRDGAESGRFASLIWRIPS